MKKNNDILLRINSISQQNHLLSLPKPEHPLVSVIKFEDLKDVSSNVKGRFSTNFYSIALKKDCLSKTKYGQQYYDFDQGVMSFVAPGQVLSWSLVDTFPPIGWLLVIHPDFVRNYPLGQKIKNYGFFYYAVNEALHLSPKEEKMVETMMKNINQEYRSSVDAYSQDVIIAHIELLLSYSNRFYNRQFITRKHVANELAKKVE